MGQRSLQSINDTYSEFEDLCEEFTRLSVEHESSYQRSFAEFKSGMKKISNAAKWLANRNTDLQRQIDSQQPALNNAIDSRNASFRKLDCAYKVIRDLVDEKERLQAALDRQSPRRTDDDDREGKWQVFREAMAISVSSGSNSSSDKTARQHQSPRHQSPLQQQGTPTKPSHSRRASMEARTKVQGSGSAGSGRQLPSPATSGAESESSDSERPSFSSIAIVDDDGRWSIHWGDPPGASNMSFGPVPHRRLLECSVITRDDLTDMPTGFSFSLEMVTGEFGLRLHAKKDLAFLNDPIFLEERAEGIKKTYLLDWSDEVENERLTRHIATKSRTPLHTFVFPGKKKHWYFVGTFTWHLADPLTVWSSLGETSKDAVLSKLLERKPEFDKEELTALLDGGHLSQICVEISSDGLWEASRDFARRLGYQSPLDRE
ncbi:hypothetical protein DXG01_005666 [Tephrocybe rancida]|nr:hypothetical protein DXG01_005666 [Tephrocybe rancida]